MSAAGPISFREWSMRWLLVLLLVLGVGACLRAIFLPSSQLRSAYDILKLLELRRVEALSMAEEHVRRYPQDPFGIALAAQAAAAQARDELAIGRFQQLPRDKGQWEFLSERGQGMRYDTMSEYSAAEKHYRAALELYPLHVETNLRLGHMLQASGRVWEAGPFFFNVISQGKCRGDDLLGMSSAERFFRLDERMIELGMARNPPEPLAMLAVARNHIQVNQSAEAERLLRAVIAVRPELGEAQGRLGRMLSDNGDLKAFEIWRQQIPKAAHDHPEVWYALGLQARRINQVEGATRCFLEALLLSPNHLASNVQIAACLEQSKQSTVAKRFADRGRILADHETGLNILRADLSENLLEKIVQNNAELGRYWEAVGWCYVMRWIDTPQEFPTLSFAKWRPAAMREYRQTSTENLPAISLKTVDFPLPNWPQFSSSSADKPSVSDETQFWGLVDRAHEVGIDFTYVEGTTEDTRMAHIFNTVGGGLGVIDFDQDGWPDLHLAQANDWRNPAPQPELSDRIYRNTGGERFVDVTMESGIAEAGFSHGVTVGDYDQDGFPDLYICNLGENRLYHNSGDGTFEDVTVRSGTAGNSEDWSTSGVFADFNGDLAPDLYVLNYSLVTPTATKICRNGNGKEMSCTPDLLLSCPDRLFVNQNDGTFRETTQESGIIDQNGRGLGVIVWPFGNDNLLGLFIANDTTSNYLFVNQGNNPDGSPVFKEEGVVRGVAYNADGNAQANMGVAAADANHDGRIELFVTTFYNDSNTYFSQQSGGFFDDLTNPYNLRNSSFKMLGFGCQFADLNSDGWPDLILTNGHVDQQTSDGTMDRMPPQVYRNIQGKRFEVVPASQLGAFFDSHYLGRGMAQLDWNRDGRSDIGITHLHGPFALVTQARETTAADRIPLVIRLVGTGSSREATGAIVEVVAVSGRIPSLQTGGNGFLVTNERRHEFFLPKAEKTVQVNVRWPTGNVETWKGIVPGTEVILTEGRLTSLPVKTLQ